LLAVRLIIFENTTTSLSLSGFIPTADGYTCLNASLRQTLGNAKPSLPSPWYDPLSSPPLLFLTTYTLISGLWTNLLLIAFYLLAFLVYVWFWLHAVD